MTSQDHYAIEQQVASAVRQISAHAGAPAAPEVIYLTGNVGRLGLQAPDREALLDGIYRGITLALDSPVTVVVPTHSWSLVGTDTPFDRKRTPSESGPITEHVRRLPGAVRQFHPFGSVTAVGPLSEELCAVSSRHLYGPETPYDRLLQYPALGLSLGMAPHRAVTVVHHLEFVMGVPYRYTKEFLHPVVDDAGERIEPFYLYVTYREAEIVRDRNAKFFAAYEQDGPVAQVPLGRSQVYGFDLVRFAATAKSMLAKDIYAWLETPPTTRPYQK
jgi:aminoglycoside 3-N-acetyltransferase